MMEKIKITWEQELAISERRNAIEKKTQEEFDAIMCLAGFPYSGSWKILNQYWPKSPTYDDVRSPWMLYRTPYGMLEMGWRKRVISISWKDFDFRQKVTQDQVTSSEDMVHAWQPEKAVEYLRNLREAVEKAKSNTTAPF